MPAADSSCLTIEASWAETGSKLPTGSSNFDIENPGFRLRALKGEGMASEVVVASWSRSLEGFT